MGLFGVALMLTSWSYANAEGSPRESSRAMVATADSEPAVLAPTVVNADGSVQQSEYQVPTAASDVEGSSSAAATGSASTQTVGLPESGDNALPETGKSNPNGIGVDFAYHFKMKSGTTRVCVDPFSGYFGDHQTNPKTIEYFNLYKEGWGGSYTQDRGIAYFGLDGKSKYFCWTKSLDAGAEYKVGWGQIKNSPNSGDNKSHITYTEQYEN